jgi:hypothetical protein
MLKVNHLHKARKVLKEQSKEDIKKPYLHLKEESPLQDRYHNKVMKMFFMVNVFHGQCYSCNEYGHKDLECIFYARRDNEIFHNTLRCCICNQIGHIVVHCHIMRCYSCSGFGHKSQD